MAVVAAAPAAAFTPGNVVVLRVGDGSGALTTSGTAAFLDEYDSSGALQSTVPLPTTGGGGNNPLVLAGTGLPEGMVTRSTDESYLVVAGYDTIPGTATVASSVSTTIPRTIARVDGAGAVDTTTALTDLSSGASVRSAFTTDGTTFWATGGAGGLRAFPLGATTSTQVNSSFTNLRVVHAFAGQLYASANTNSPSLRLGTVGTGLPTTGGQIITSLSGIPTTISPYQFQLLDLSDAVAGVDTLYVADDTVSTGGIQKYSLVDEVWTSDGTVTASGVRGLTASASGDAVTVYATSSTNLYKVTDGSGYNASPPATATPIATNATNTAFRGVALAPSAPPEPPTFTGTSPVSPANDNSPSVQGNAPAGSTVALYTNATCTGSAAGTDSAANFASPGIAVSVPDNSTTTFHAVATDAADHSSVCSPTSISYTEDSTPPDTSITSGPLGPTKDSTPTFGFTSTETGSSFECKVEGTMFVSCTSPKTTAVLADGAHTFYVRATDQADNTDGTPAHRSFKVDTHAPASKASAPTSTHNSPFVVTYTASDPLPSTGLASVELWAHRPGQVGYSKVATDTTPTTTRSFLYKPTAGAGTYRFYTRARDKARNYEPAPGSADASTVFSP